MCPPLIHLKHLRENARSPFHAHAGYRGSRKGLPRRQMKKRQLASFFHSRSFASVRNKRLWLRIETPPQPLNGVVFPFASIRGPKRFLPSYRNSTQATQLASFLHSRPFAAQTLFGFVSKIHPSHSNGFVFTFPSICGQSLSPRYLPKGFGTLNPPPHNIVIEVTRCI